MGSLLEGFAIRGLAVVHRLGSCGRRAAVAGWSVPYHGGGVQPRGASVSRRGVMPDKPQSWAIPHDGGRDSRQASGILDRSIPGRMERPLEVGPMAAWTT